MHARTLLSSLLPALLLLASAGTAQASPVFANAATTVGTPANSTITITGASAALDGANFVVHNRTQRSPPGAPPVGVIDFGFPSPINSDHMTVWANARNPGNVSTMTVVALIDGNGNVATRSGAGTTVPNAGGPGNYAMMSLQMPFTSFTTPVGFNLATVKTVRVRSTLSSSNSGTTTVDIDGVQVAPEPGSAALFGLGALLFLGRTRRRRAARRRRAGYDRATCASPSSPQACSTP